MQKVAQRIYRDPVHDIITLRDDTAEEQLMISLIDTAEFQRLRRIKQLGLGLYTYQGAEHSRFTHSLGALHLMTRVLDRLSDRANIALEDRAAARAAALLHDVGHGPFSHAMEKVLGVHHEQMTMLAVEKFREMGMAQVRLETAAPNEAARGLFASCGFRVSSVEMLYEIAGEARIQNPGVPISSIFWILALGSWLLSHA